MPTTTTDKIQTLRCNHGEGHDWSRPAQRGKPPHFCPEHKPAGQVKLVKAAPKLEAKVAQANAEIAELDAEEARKRAEAAKKRAATIAANKEREAAEAAANAAQELESLKKQIPALFAEYDKVLTQAAKNNKTEDWKRSSILQNRVLSMRGRQRSLEQVAA